MYLCAQNLAPSFRSQSGRRTIAPRNSGLFCQLLLNRFSMRGKSAGEKKVLRHEIKTRVNDQKFQELNDLLVKTRCRTMSELVRNILHNRPIKIYTVDESFHKQMEEISGVRKELKAIGINI